MSAVKADIMVFLAKAYDHVTQARIVTFNEITKSGEERKEGIYLLVDGLFIHGWHLPFGTSH